MTGHREKARQLASDFIVNGDFKARLSMRLVLVQLLGGAGLKDEARELFDPLFENEIEFDHLRRNAARLALLLYPREKVLTLLPEIKGESPYRRQIAISSLLPYPPKVAIFCYEEFLKTNPDLSPLEILTLVEQHLSRDNSKLLQHYQSELEPIDQKFIKSTDPIFHLALFLKAPKISPGNSAENCSRQRHPSQL